MAELVVSMAIAPLVSMLKDKASSYLLDQYNVMEGMEEQHKTLKRKLPAILDVITDAEEQATAHREGAKAWLQELKTVTYEANQVFDEFKYEALRREAKKKGHYRELGFDAFKLFPTHNRIVFRYKMSCKLCRILQAVEVLISEMHAFRFKYRPQPPVSKEWRKTNHFINDPREIARRSRDIEKKEIVDILLGQASNADLAVVSIVGMGGLGKTTLAELIYNEPQVQKHFQLLLWVCVSDTFDVDSLAKCIVEASTKMIVDTDKPPLDRLQKLVSGQRYLLVLDDVWNNREFHKWESLKTCLQHGGTGSAVLTTTRDKRVAEIMGTNTTKDLSILDDRFIKEIIEARAFTPDKKNPAELLQLVGDTVKRCSGSPLAATALGSVLRTKTSMKEWKAVSSRSNICTEETGILPILKLSYNDLASYMKQCFAFCAIFPKGYKIDVDKLIQLWIANGFIPEHKEDSLETIGKDIFNELGSRSFFQDIEETKDFTGEYSITTCKIHDLMHDIALSVMEKECFIATKNTSQTEGLPDTVRHVFLSHEAPIGLLNNSIEKRSPAIQTLLCNTHIDNSLQHMSRYSSLHVFKLRLWTVSFLPKPKHLHQLRYLDLSDSAIKARPEDISILYNLQMLDLSRCSSLAQLPRQMKYLASLRHLYTHGCHNLESMPPELGRLTKLQTLTCFVAATTTPNCSDVAELENLNLCGQLELCRIENIGIEAQAKLAILGKKNNLRELRLRWTSVCDSQVLNNFEPHGELQILRIFSYGGKCVGMLQNLVEIHLSHCERLQVLFRCSFFFPKLKQLTLEHLLEFEIWWEISEHIAFPLLEKLFIRHSRKLEALPRAPLLPERLVRLAFPALKVLEMKNLECFQRWGATVEGVEMFPQLEELSIEQCPNLIALPESPLLQETCIRGGYRMVPSAFPTLKVLKMVGLETFQGWDAAVEILFPLLVELSVEKCPKLIALPYAPLLQEPCSGSYRSVFPVLKVLILDNLMSFQRWDATVEGEDHILFPQLENLSIRRCPQLTTLPKAPLLQEPCCGGYGSVHSAFPALKVLRMEHLRSFQRWDAVEETQVFPQLENLSIQECPMLTTLPKAAPLLQEPCSGGYGSVRSAFPALKVLRMEYLQSFQRWDAVEETQGEHMSFPQLEKLSIQKCPKLIGLPEAPKLSVLEIAKCKLEVGQWVVRYLSSLTMLMLKLEDTETTSEVTRSIIELVGSKEKWNQKSLLTVMKSTCCNSLFGSGALEPWDYLVHLDEVEINRCDVLVNWPEKVFQSLVSLRKLVIRRCNNLTGYAQPPLEASATERSQHLPGLKFLCLQYCASLVEMFNVPTSLKGMTIEYCNKLESIFGRQQLGMSELGQGSSCSEAILPIAVSELSSSPMNHFCPFLEDLVLSGCDSLSAVLYLPPSLKTIYICGCSSIQVLSCQLDDLPKPQVTTSIIVSEPSAAEHSLPPYLESLTIQFCAMLGGILCLPTSLKKLKIKNSGLTSLEPLSGEPPSLESLKHVSCSTLASLPNEQKAYGPLQELVIEGCPTIKKLPRSLQQQLGSIDYKRLDAQYEVMALNPKTWKKIPRLLLERRRQAELSTREAEHRRLYAKRRAERRRQAIRIIGEQEGTAIHSGE